MRTIFIAIAFFVWGSVAFSAKMTPAEIEAAEKADKIFRDAISKMPMPPAHKLLNAETYVQYKKNLWKNNCKQAAHALKQVIEKKYPKLMALRHKDLMMESQIWWTYVGSKYYRREWDCGFVKAVAYVERKLKEQGLVQKPLKSSPGQERINPDLNLRDFYISILTGSVAEDYYADKRTEVGLIGLARYLLDRNDKYKPAWISIQSDFPLFLLARAAVLAKNHGDGDNLPPDYDKLIARAKALAGPERAARALGLAKHKPSHKFIMETLKLRLQQVGRPLTDAKKLPPFFVPDWQF